MRSVLSKRMSLQAFENGYWYATDLVEFGKKLGLPAAHRMRKNELESAIKAYLTTGRLPKTTPSKPLKKGVRDLGRGLRLDLPIANYTSNRETKDFIVRAAQRKRPGLKAKSGVWYRLNRWREANVANGSVTYGDLVEQFISLNSVDRFERIPHEGYYIHFLADYFAAEKDASRKDALAAWKNLKNMNVPKTYKSWRAAALKKRVGSTI
jgi:SAP domain-containing new25